ncbi:MAG: dockerin type I repeat-containing protein [Ruminococcus sp.]|nr:dockerin type I repeat-containing protein [Ruminococcus sp.]
MNKKLKRMIATVSAVVTCAVSAVSTCAGAIATFTDREVTAYTTSFSAIVNDKSVKFHLWQEATDYFDDKSNKIYISDKILDEFGEEYTYKMISHNNHYYVNSTQEWMDYWSVAPLGFGSYMLNNKEDVDTLEKYLLDNNIIYEKSEYASGDLWAIYIKDCIEISYYEFKPIYTDDEYFELLQKIKKDTGFITTCISPADITEITDVENELPEPTLLGDANEDGVVNISDAVLIMQSISNPTEYQLSIQGMANADVVDNDGVTLLDALRIQEMSAGL